jgi:hypothetical protein
MTLSRAARGGRATARKKAAVAIERARYMGIKVPKRLSAKWKRKINAKFRGRGGLKTKLLPLKSGVNMGLLVDQKRYRQLVIGTCLGTDTHKRQDTVGDVEHYILFSDVVEEIRAEGDREKRIMDGLDIDEERELMLLDDDPSSLNVPVYGDEIIVDFYYPVTGFYMSASDSDGLHEQIIDRCYKHSTHTTILLISERVRYAKR